MAKPIPDHSDRGRGDLSALGRTSQTDAKRYVPARTLLLRDVGEHAPRGAAWRMSPGLWDRCSHRRANQGALCGGWIGGSAGRQAAERSPEDYLFDGALEARGTALVCSDPPDGCFPVNRAPFRRQSRGKSWRRWARSRGSTPAIDGAAVAVQEHGRKHRRRDRRAATGSSPLHASTDVRQICNLSGRARARRRVPAACGQISGKGEADETSALLEVGKSRRRLPWSRPAPAPPEPPGPLASQQVPPHFYGEQGEESTRPIPRNS